MFSAVIPCYLDPKISQILLRAGSANAVTSAPELQQLDSHQAIEAMSHRSAPSRPATANTNGVPARLMCRWQMDLRSVTLRPVRVKGSPILPGTTSQLQAANHSRAIATVLGLPSAIGF